MAVPTIAPVSRRAAARAVIVRTPIHRRGSLVCIDEHAANISAKWCSSRCQQSEEVSSEVSVQPGIYFEIFPTTGLLHDPVCHAGDWEGVRLWPRPLPAGRGPDGADDHMTDEVGKEKNNLPLIAGVSLLARVGKANRMASSLPNVLISVAITPGHNVGIKLKSCSFTTIRTTSKSLPTPGAKARSVPVAAETTTRHSGLTSLKGVPFGTQKHTMFCNLPLNQRGRSDRLKALGGERTPKVPGLHCAAHAPPAQTVRPST